ncbi:ABC transporter permease [Hymenobacter jeollabukensis]|uniref:ABC transporter permease n=1 Tax=Hymenobacter jeollabukensis TaxID=2025313 RepID=A0A5R8WQI7_9BACT|nr:ABC transporter permease [Hymenobacter jeollabukensis]TLM92231.1 ABC transporter permease [Hymenobacter jeollabukensis]
MVRALLVRTARALSTAWLIASAIFLLSRSLPGSGPRLLTDEQASPFGQQATTEARYQQRLGLQTPPFYFRLLPWRWHGTPNQYHSWLTELAQGNLGTSFRDDMAVTTHLRQALRLTLPLTVSALLLSAGAALLLAQWAVHRPRWYHWLLVAGYFLDSLPLFVVGMTLLLVLANPDFWPLFPAYGLPAAASPAGTLSWEMVPYLVLPVAALTLTSVPALFLPLAAALREQAPQLYVTAARAKGASRHRISWHHLLPNVMPVFLTRLADLVPGVVAGALVVEVVFALPGMGRLLAEAVAARDVPILVGGVLLVACVRLLAWLLADFTSALVDPRLL